MSRSRSADPTEELQYFGAVMAVISHDIKNTLSVIAENAGLFQDLVAAVGSTGRPPELDKLSTIATRITKHTARADGIVKHMNTFAHSVDEPLRELDVTEMARLTAEVGQRRWNASELEIHIRAPETPIRRTCPPFGLLRAIWSCLELLTRCPAEDRQVSVDITEQGRRSSIRFAPLGPLNENGVALLQEFQAGLSSSFSLEQCDNWLRLEIIDRDSVPEHMCATERSS